MKVPWLFKNFLAAAVALLVLLAAGCSMVSVGYQHAPTLLSWRATQYFGLDSAQRIQFRTRLESVHAWHRSEALPDLIRTLDEAHMRLSRPVEVGDGVWFAESLLGHYRLAVTRIIDESSDLVATLRPEQIETLESRLAEKALEFQEKWIDAPPQRVRRARFNRVLEHAEGWLGRLSSEQRAWLQERLDRIPADYLAFRAQRARREAELIALLKDGTSGRVQQVSLDASSRAALHRWAVDWDDGRTPEERRKADEARTAYIELAVELLERATPEQRERVRTRLTNYMAALSEQVIRR